MHKMLVLCSLGAACTLQACSSRPREFVPSLASPAVDKTRFDKDYAECRQLMVAGKLDSNGNLASVATGAGAVATVGAAGGMAASSAGLYAGAAIASATLVALPLVAIGGAWGMAKAKRKKKEAAVQRVMEICLQQRGYSVTSWAPAAKRTSTSEATTAER